MKKYKLTDQLFLVTNNKQYDALTLEIEHLKEKKEDHETKILEHIEENEKLEENIDANEKIAYRIKIRFRCAAKIRGGFIRDS